MGCRVTSGNAGSSDRLFPRVGGFGDDGEEEGLRGNFFVFFHGFFSCDLVSCVGSTKIPFSLKASKAEKIRTKWDFLLSLHSVWVSTYG